MKPDEPKLGTAAKPCLTADELVALAQRMVACKNPDEIEKLKVELERGFYGDA
jgi:hypothetical protein